MARQTTALRSVQAMAAVVGLVDQRIRRVWTTHWTSGSAFGSLKARPSANLAANKRACVDVVGDHMCVVRWR